MVAYIFLSFTVSLLVTAVVAVIFDRWRRCGTDGPRDMNHSSLGTAH
jgi:hypothetical protein